MVTSLCPWRDSAAAFRISLLAVIFQQDMNIVDLINTSPLKIVIYLIINFRGKNIQVPKINGEMGHFSDPGERLMVGRQVIQ